MTTPGPEPREPSPDTGTSPDIGTPAEGASAETVPSTTAEPSVTEPAPTEASADAASPSETQAEPAPAEGVTQAEAETAAAPVEAEAAPEPEEAVRPEPVEAGASAPAGSWWAGHRRPAAIVLGLVAASLAVWLAVAQFGGLTPPPSRLGPNGNGPSDSTAPSVAGTTGPSVVQEVPGVPAPPPPVIPKQASGEAGFAGELAAPGASGPPTVDPNLVGIARQACTALQAGSSRAAVERAVMQSGNRDQKGAEAVVTAALGNFCPDQARPAATSFRDGTFQAGTDVAPGAYRTAAGKGCTWLRSTSPDASNLAGIVESGSGDVAKTVTLDAGQFFTTSGCAEWAKVR